MCVCVHVCVYGVRAWARCLNNPLPKAESTTDVRGLRENGENGQGGRLGTVPSQDDEPITVRHKMSAQAITET